MKFNGKKEFIEAKYFITLELNVAELSQLIGWIGDQASSSFSSSLYDQLLELR